MDNKGRIRSFGRIIRHTNLTVNSYGMCAHISIVCLLINLESLHSFQMLNYCWHICNTENLSVTASRLLNESIFTELNGRSANIIICIHCNRTALKTDYFARLNPDIELKLTLHF